jgi:hypothetical protein
MSFLQMKASMTMKVKLRQVQSAIYMNSRQQGRTTLIVIFGRWHLAIKVAEAVYVTRRAHVEVVPWLDKNCTEEIPVSTTEEKCLWIPSVM